MSSDDKNFAILVLSHLRQLDTRAHALVPHGTPRTRGVQIGIFDDGEFVPLLKLDAASGAHNKMSLFIRHHDRWMPTFERGTPAKLAELLAGSLSYVWTIAVAAMDNGGSSVQ